ncbi:MAG: glutamate-5-semialdehyde dehydrogenase [Verrucomicrobiales bacterium]
MSLESDLLHMGERARAAALALAQVPTAAKNRILLAMADELMARERAILDANARDLEAAETAGLSAAMKDRLRLDGKRLSATASGVRQVASLPDPVGEVLASWERPNGLRIEKKRVPIGVIGIIFESRPNVTSDAAVLCFKSGNATILRGGKESVCSNMAIAAALEAGGRRAGMPPDCVQLVPTIDREAVRLLCGMNKYLDLIIPRGGRGLIETVVSLARMPVIKHYDGICHLYVDAAADPDMAVRLIVNGKAQKPSACNSLESLLIHESAAAELLPRLVPALAAAGVTLRADDRLRALLRNTNDLRVEPASDGDWETEYLDLILAAKLVSSDSEAIDHINRHGSKHSDVIVTENPDVADRFLSTVDSACCFWNASSRFNDGEEFGFGAEIGISTDKLHARGPMALPELTSYKYLIRGTGQIRG